MNYEKKFKSITPKDNISISKEKIHDILIYFKNKKNILSHNINKYEKDLSKNIKNYERKSDKNNSLYKIYRSNYENFEKINSKIRNELKPKEKILISDLIKNYNIKRNLDFSKEEINENIFKKSSLIESNLFRLKMDYLLNYRLMKKEVKENESRNIKMDKFYKTMIIRRNNDIKINQSNSDNFINKNIHENKFCKQLNCLNDFKYIKKLNVITKSKLMDDDLYGRFINRKEIRNYLKQLEEKGDIEELYNCKKSIKDSLKDIDTLKKFISNFEKEENNKNTNNIIPKASPKGKSKSLFYIPTLVKSFPELLYDKLNKNQFLTPKDNITNDSSISLKKTLDKSNSLKGKRKTCIIEEYNNNNKKRINNQIISKYKEILKMKKLKLLDPSLYKKMILSKSRKNASKINKDKNIDTTKLYNQILNMSIEDKNSAKSGELMRTFLNEKNNDFVNSINENKPKNYFKSLRKIHLQFNKEYSTERLYDSNLLLYNQKTNNLFKELKNFRNNLRLNEKLLIKSLLIEKENES